MNDIFESPAFQEFLQKRCEEILTEDEKCINLNREILMLEKEILPMLSTESRDIFLKIDELALELIDRIFVLSPPIILRQTDKKTINVEDKINRL